ncbi:hypothetical protein ANCCAN_10598 [Ancylostoma caninum]|uniref:Glycosyl hydrolase family 25 n=1 Tax=Ancylostoma caninum TaxID=29170 RepID=A0A368GKJ4_ANCCA|nr:hypothetical protein ANCCAN_10598 [Ancylostoma caninum]
MRILFILQALLATCLANVISEPLVAASSGYAYAVDLDRAVSPSAFTCMKRSGYSTVFIRAYDPTGSGRFDVNAVNNIRNANKAGLGTEVFMTPQIRSSKRGSQQFRELYDGLRRGNIVVRTVWLQVTSPVNWGANNQANIYFLNDIIATAKSVGVTIGFYTNAYDWQQITKGAWVQGAMLWYWNVNGGGAQGETPANFNDFRPFGKFTKPTVKQFGQVENVCGVTVNRDVYTLSRSMAFLAPSNDEFVVGNFGGEPLMGLLKTD